MPKLLRTIEPIDPLLCSIYVKNTSRRHIPDNSPISLAKSQLNKATLHLPVRLTRKDSSPILGITVEPIEPRNSGRMVPIGIIATGTAGQSIRIGDRLRSNRGSLFKKLPKTPRSRLAGIALTNASPGELLHFITGFMSYADKY